MVEVKRRGWGAAHARTLGPKHLGDSGLATQAAQVHCLSERLTCPRAAQRFRDALRQPPVTTEARAPHLANPLWPHHGLPHEMLRTNGDASLHNSGCGIDILRGPRSGRSIGSRRVEQVIEDGDAA